MSDVNQFLVTNPKLALKDPYGDGWLLTVHAPDTKTSFRNLHSRLLRRRLTRQLGQMRA